MFLLTFILSSNFAHAASAEAAAATKALNQLSGELLQGFYVKNARLANNDGTGKATIFVSRVLETSTGVKFQMRYATAPSGVFGFFKSSVNGEEVFDVTNVSSGGCYGLTFSGRGESSGIGPFITGLGRGQLIFELLDPSDRRPRGTNTYECIVNR